jgi:hypothetical protein
VEGGFLGPDATLHTQIDADVTNRERAAEFARDVFAVMSAGGENIAVDHEVRAWVEDEQQQQQQQQQHACMQCALRGSGAQLAKGW